MHDSNADVMTPPRGFDPEPWRGELLAFLRRMGAAADAEDIVQETFLRSVRRPPTGNARPWLYGIALNLLRDRRRADRRDDEHLPHVARRPLNASSDPAEDAERHELASRAWSVIETLSQSQRAALLMRIERHLGYAEIATALGCSEATARQHFYLGMKAVRDRLHGGET